MQSMASSRVRCDPYNGEDDYLQRQQGSDLDDLLDFTNVSINTRSSDKIPYTMKIYTEFTFINFNHINYHYGTFKNCDNKS